METEVENKQKANQRKCVYTVITGHYENLVPPTVFPGSDWDYICLTENPELVSDIWKIRLFRPPFKNDHARNSRLPKACPHRYLPDYEVSLYIDNTVTLKVPPEEIEKALFPEEAFEWGVFRHSFRSTVLDEFNRVMRLSLDEPTRVLEQFITYKTVMPDLLTAAPIWAGFLLRRHHSENVIAAGEAWYAHILRHSRRDQLSLPYVLADYRATVNMVDKDNRNSELHTWNNKIPSRNRTRRRAGWKEMLPLDIRIYYQVTRMLRKAFKVRLHA